MLQLSEDLLDGVEVGTVGRQEQEPGADTPDRSADRLPFMAAEIVHDHDIAGLKRWQQKPLYIGEEANAIDGAIEQAGCLYPVAAQSGNKGQRSPATVRRLADEA